MIRKMLRPVKRACLRAVMPWHDPAHYLRQSVFRQSKMRVLEGPFAGMAYVESAVGSAFFPKLVGAYEKELHGVIEAACARRPKVIIDVGAAEGYYAVGMALKNPQARVIAFEMNPDGRALIAQLAEINGVARRIEVRGKCEPEDLLAAVAEGVGSETLMICDVEGYEMELFTPETARQLAGVCVLMETHDVLIPGCAEAVRKVMAATHDIQDVRTRERVAADFPLVTFRCRLASAAVRARMLAEWRAGPMTFFWMTPRKK